MGYFDSNKNRALWEIELQNLKKLRAERAAGKHVTVERTVTHVLSGKEPVRMTYAELLKEEAAAQKAPKKERQAAMEAAKTRQREMQNEAPPKEARAYEKV